MPFILSEEDRTKQANSSVIHFWRSINEWLEQNEWQKKNEAMQFNDFYYSLEEKNQ